MNLLLSPNRAGRRGPTSIGGGHFARTPAAWQAAILILASEGRDMGRGERLRALDVGDSRWLPLCKVRPGAKMRIAACQG